MCTLFHLTNTVAANRHPERGQATIARVGVLAVACVAMVGLSIVGQAIVHRARARNAADAVALAAAVDQTAADALSDWYLQRNISVEQNNMQTIARSGPSQAAAWASTQRSTTQPAPALIAIVARAEQLVGTTFTPVHWQAIAVTLSDKDAGRMTLVAAELGLCKVPAADITPDATIFKLC